MNPVLETTKFVLENSKSVGIDKNKIREFCKSYHEENAKSLADLAPFNYTSFDEENKLSFLFVLHSNSFCYWGSPKWTIKYKGEMYDGTIGLIAALGRAIEKGMPLLNFNYLSKISKEELGEILKANVKIPLFDERLKIFRELGSVITKKYGGSCSYFVKQAGGDALKLLDLIVSEFKTFYDVSVYRGRKIYFYKRAQLLISDIYDMFDGMSAGNLKNMKNLTTMADYKIPQVLRHFGILSYSPELAIKVDKGIIIPHDGEEEIEIRANTIWAVEFIKKELIKKGLDTNSVSVGNHLWHLSQDKSKRFKPYHLSSNIFY